MSFVWFNQVLSALGKRLNYESISNLYGNSFCKDSADIISRANPLIHGTPKGAISNFASEFAVIDDSSKTKTKEQKEAEDTLNNLDWAEGLFDAMTDEDLAKLQ